MAVVVLFAGSPSVAQRQPAGPPSPPNAAQAVAPSDTSPQQEQPQEQEQAPPKRERAPRGFFDAVGRWIDKSATDIKGTFGGIGKKTTGAAKDAVDNIVKLPGARVVEGRERCAIAANGSPDCHAAAETLCKAKGYASGNSLDVQSTQKCPMRTWLSGRHNEGECSVETYVIRSMCQ